MFTCFKTKNTKRNEKCGCGSGKKNKICCRTISEYTFLDKRKEENKRVQEAQAQEIQECQE
jgi:hypothetical protein